jgi:hypothetical protein
VNNPIQHPADLLPGLVDLWLEDPEAMAVVMAKRTDEEREWIEGARVAADSVRQGTTSLADAKAAVATVAERHYPRTRRAEPRPKISRSQAHTRPRAPRRSPRRGGAKTAQDPGSDDGGDPDPDPVGEAIKRLLDSAPPFSVGQRALLGRLLGGAS